MTEKNPFDLCRCGHYRYQHDGIACDQFILKKTAVSNIDLHHQPVTEFLREIKGGGTGPKPWRRLELSEPEQVTCWRCEKDTGVASSVAIKVVLAPRSRDGKKIGGTELWACAMCLARGVITELIKA